MGLYLEVDNKKTWLAVFGHEIEEQDYIKEDEVKVVLVDNGMFYAALVIHDAREFKYISQAPTDRETKWYRVQREQLRPHCPNWNLYMKEEAK